MPNGRRMDRRPFVLRGAGGRYGSSRNPRICAPCLEHDAVRLLEAQQIGIRHVSAGSVILGVEYLEHRAVEGRRSGVADRGGQVDGAIGVAEQDTVHEVRIPPPGPASKASWMVPPGPEKAMPSATVIMPATRQLSDMSVPRTPPGPVEEKGYFLSSEPHVSTSASPARSANRPLSATFSCSGSNS